VTGEAVDDFLGVGDLAVRDLRALVLVGRSGSGKSTLLHHLIATHPDLVGEDVVVLDARPMNWRAARRLRDRVVLVDEVLTWREVPEVYRLAARGCRVLVASHAPAALYAPLRFLGPIRTLHTDRDPAKLRRYLARRGVRSDADALRAYLRRYGATYTDLDIVLERCPSDDLSVALARFHRHHRIEHRPVILRG